MQEKSTYNKSHKSWINLALAKGIDNAKQSGLDKALPLRMDLYSENTFEMNYT